MSAGKLRTDTCRQKVLDIFARDGKTLQHYLTDAQDRPHDIPVYSWKIRSECPSKRRKNISFNRCSQKIWMVCTPIL